MSKTWIFEIVCFFKKISTQLHWYTIHSLKIAQLPFEKAGELSKDAQKLFVLLSEKDVVFVL